MCRFRWKKRTTEEVNPMKKQIFKLLAALNKVIMPRYSQRDITKLSKVDKALVAYRYWVTINALDWPSLEVSVKLHKIYFLNSIIPPIIV